jgi:hypothetical protein
MDFPLWLTENAFNLLNALGIVGSLLFTAHSLRSETKTRRVANFLAITEAHRNIWKEHFQNPQLARVLSTLADLAKEPVTREEEIFVNLVIQHLGVVFQSTKDELMINLEGLRRDVASFFSLPIPAEVWKRLKVMQNHRFIAFVDECLSEK